jgi:hypothetical protein
MEERENSRDDYYYDDDDDDDDDYDDYDDDDDDDDDYDDYDDDDDDDDDDYDDDDDDDDDYDDDDDDDDDYDDDEEDDEDNDGEYVPYVDFTPLYERHESIYDNNTFYIDDNTKKEIKKKRIKSIFRNHGRLPIIIDPNELYKMSLRGVIHKVSLSGFKNIKSKGMNNLRCEETSQEGMVQRIIVDNTVMSYFGQEFPYKSTVIIEYN